ncbi:MAG TPA: thiamine pyrophosphate-binding protein [Woeseiaceae bacterium]|nr:thiamine pyrophosphate-binding protein [Woeseiaceae bacterium]
MLGSEVLVKMLTGYGVDTIFGVPGDTNVPLYAALDDAKGEIRHVMARDERGAGFMADAYARVSNKVGVFEAPSGAGAMYSLPPLAESNASSVAVILFTIDVPLICEGRGVITELDCKTLFEPVSKASIQVKSAEKIPEIVRRAFRTATTGKPGAVHVVVPEDMLKADVDPSKISLHVEEECKTFPAIRSVAPSDTHRKLMTMLSQAKRPLLVAGGGVNRSMAQPELLEFINRFQIPVVSTITGQCAIEPNHPLEMGVIGDNGFHPHANKALDESDLTVYLGSKVGSVVTIGWTFPSERPDRKIIQVDIDAEVLSNNTRNTLSIFGDVKAVLAELLKIDDIKLGDYSKWVAEVNGWRSNFWLNAEPLFNERTKPVRPEPVVKAFNDRIKGAVNILSDAGTPTPYMTRFLRLADPGSRIIIPRAFGGLGYAIPAVVGAWMAEPDKRPIGMFGDGSLGMTAGELETLVRLKCPALLIHFNNACFGWIKGLQRLDGYDNDNCYSVDFDATKASAVAEAFGMKAWHVTDMDELETAMDEAFAYDGPCLIDIVVESLAERVPPVYSWLKKRGKDPLSNKADAVWYS